MFINIIVYKLIYFKLLLIDFFIYTVYGFVLSYLSVVILSKFVSGHAQNKSCILAKMVTFVSSLISKSVKGEFEKLNDTLHTDG